MGIPSFILQRLHRVRSASCQRVIDTGVAARSLAYGGEGSEILVGHDDGVPRLWDLAHFELARAFVPHEAPVLSVSARGSRWATACANGRVRIWAGYGEPVREFRAAKGEPDLPCWSVGWNQEGTHLVTGHEDRTTRVYDPEQGKRVKKMLAPFSPRAVTFGPEQTQVSLLETGEVVVWEAQHPTPAAQFRACEVDPRLPGRFSIAFSRDRRTIAASARSSEIQLSHWDEPVCVLSGHTDVVTSLAWSPEGRFLLSGSEDCTARIWDTTARECVATINEVGAVLAVAFHPHGHECATLGEDGALRIYELGSAWFDLAESLDQAASALEGHAVPLWPKVPTLDLDFVLDVWSDLRRRARHQRIEGHLAARGERVRSTVVELLALLCEGASPTVPDGGMQRYKHPLFRVARSDLRLAADLCRRLGGDPATLTELNRFELAQTGELAASGISLVPKRPG